MRSLKGQKITESGCSDPRLNVFYTEYGDGSRVVFRQPRKGDSGRQRVAWRELGEQGRMRYVRANVDQNLYDMNTRCRMPLYRGECPGVMPLTIEFDGRAVGFSDLFFNTGEYFKRFGVEPEAKCCNGSIAALDKYKGIGVGTAYAATSNYIGKHFGCQYMLGRTRVKDGMRSIRAKEDPPWVVVGSDGVWVDHVKSLI